MVAEISMVECKLLRLYCGRVVPGHDERLGDLSTWLIVDSIHTQYAYPSLIVPTSPLTMSIDP